MNRNLNPDEFKGAWPEELPQVGDESFPHRNRANQRSLQQEKNRRVSEWQHKGEDKLNQRIGEEVEILGDSEKGTPPSRAKFVGSKSGTAQFEFPDGHVEPRPYGGYRFLKD